MVSLRRRELSVGSQARLRRSCGPYAALRRRATVPGLLRTIPTLMRDAVDAAGDQPWLVTDDVEHTYSEALARVERAASGLRSARVGVGDRVLVTARNTPDYLLSWLALMEVGAIQIP